MKSVTIVNFSWSKSKHREGLSLDQMQAFDLIHDWYGSNPDMPFVLRGYAGTGKTFLVQRLIQYESIAIRLCNYCTSISRGNIY